MLEYQKNLAGPELTFDGWQSTNYVIIDANHLAWGVPPEEFTTLSTRKAAWDGAFAVGGIQHKTTRTSEQVTAKNQERRLYVKTIRSFLKRFVLYNPLVTNAQRTSMRLPLYDRVKTSINAPATAPMVDVAYGRGNRLIFTFRQQPDAKGVSHRGKPEDVHGVKIYYKKGIPVPVTVDDCNKTKTFTSMKGVLSVFTAADAGLAVNGFAVFVNEKEEEGPPSEMFSAVVPK